MKEEGEEVVKWVKHYSSAHQILLVGEGDFSFSLSLANAFGSASNMVTTSLDSYDTLLEKYNEAKSNLVCLKKMGATVLHGVDAKKLTSHQELEMRKFDRIVFNFPHAGFIGSEDNWMVIEVIPKSLMPREIIGETFGEVRAVSDMHERKAEMARRADAFIALPGGYGTLEELLEVITWAQLGIHNKPVGLINVDGYYDTLLSFIDLAVNEEFISPKARRIIVSAPSAKELVRKLEEYVPQPDEFVSKLSWDVEPWKLVAEVDSSITSAS